MDMNVNGSDGAVLAVTEATTRHDGDDDDDHTMTPSFTPPPPPPPPSTTIASASSSEAPPSIVARTAFQLFRDDDAAHGRLSISEFHALPSEDTLPYHIRAAEEALVAVLERVERDDDGARQRFAVAALQAAAHYLSRLVSFLPRMTRSPAATRVHVNCDAVVRVVMLYGSDTDTLLETVKKLVLHQAAASSAAAAAATGGEATTDTTAASSSSSPPPPVLPLSALTDVENAVVALEKRYRQRLRDSGGRVEKLRRVAPERASTTATTPTTTATRRSDVLATLPHNNNSSDNNNNGMHSSSSSTAAKMTAQRSRSASPPIRHTPSSPCGGQQLSRSRSSRASTAASDANNNNTARSSVRAVTPRRAPSPAQHQQQRQQRRRQPPLPRHTNAINATASARPPLVPRKRTRSTTHERNNTDESGDEATAATPLHRHLVNDDADSEEGDGAGDNNSGSMTATNTTATRARSSEKADATTTTTAAAATRTRARPTAMSALCALSRSRTLCAAEKRAVTALQQVLQLLAHVYATRYNDLVPIFDHIQTVVTQVQGMMDAERAAYQAKLQTAQQTSSSSSAAAVSALPHEPFRDVTLQPLRQAVATAAHTFREDEATRVELDEDLLHVIAHACLTAVNAMEGYETAAYVAPSADALAAKAAARAATHARRVAAAEAAAERARVRAEAAARRAEERMQLRQRLGAMIGGGGIGSLGHDAAGGAAAGAAAALCPDEELHDAVPSAYVRYDDVTTLLPLSPAALAGVLQRRDGVVCAASVARVARHGSSAGRACAGNGSGAADETTASHVLVALYEQALFVWAMGVSLPRLLALSQMPLPLFLRGLLDDDQSNNGLMEEYTHCLLEACVQHARTGNNSNKSSSSSSRQQQRRRGGGQYRQTRAPRVVLRGKSWFDALVEYARVVSGDKQQRAAARLRALAQRRRQQQQQQQAQQQQQVQEEQRQQHTTRTKRTATRQRRAAARRGGGGASSSSSSSLSSDEESAAASSSDSDGSDDDESTYSSSDSGSGFSSDDDDNDSDTAARKRRRADDTNSGDDDDEEDDEEGSVAESAASTTRGAHKRSTDAAAAGDDENTDEAAAAAADDKDDDDVSSGGGDGDALSCALQSTLAHIAELRAMATWGNVSVADRLNLLQFCMHELLQSDAARDAADALLRAHEDERTAFDKHMREICDDAERELKALYKEHSKHKAHDAMSKRRQQQQRGRRGDKQTATAGANAEDSAVKDEQQQQEEEQGEGGGGGHDGNVKKEDSDNDNDNDEEEDDNADDARAAELARRRAAIVSAAEQRRRDACIRFFATADGQDVGVCLRPLGMDRYRRLYWRLPFARCIHVQTTPQTAVADVPVLPQPTELRERHDAYGGDEGRRRHGDNVGTRAPPPPLLLDDDDDENNNNNKDKSSSSSITTAAQQQQQRVWGVVPAEYLATFIGGLDGRGEREAALRRALEELLPYMQSLPAEGQTRTVMTRARAHMHGYVNKLRPDT